MVFVKNWIDFSKKFGGVSQKIKPVISLLNLGDPFVYQKIKVRGLGFRQMKDVNLSLISKLGWQLLSGHNNLWVYFFNKSISGTKISYPLILPLALGFGMV
jgi:hypothetical protein